MKRNKAFLAMRKMSGYTQAQMARNLGLYRSHLSKVERGERIVSLALIDAWAKFYDMEPHEVLKQLDDLNDN